MWESGGQAVRIELRKPTNAWRRAKVLAAEGKIMQTTGLA
jgi:hypothetical protein